MQVYGASRRLVNSVHEMSLRGQSLYVEALLPTAAMLHGLKVVWLKGATPSHEAYHCCTGEAERLYQDFSQKQVCTNLMLVHPVKKDVTHLDKLAHSLHHSSGNST